MSRIHAPHVEGRFGTDASDTLLCAAVYLGMLENRQMNASKLAGLEEHQQTNMLFLTDGSGKCARDYESKVVPLWVYATNPIAAPRDRSGSLPHWWRLPTGSSARPWRSTLN
jgi:hypothetical protein